MKTVSLIGAPTDVGASVRGAGMGPDALRVAGIGDALRNHGLGVIDRGNLAGPPNPWKAPANGMMSYRGYDKRDRIQKLWVMSLPNATPDTAGVSIASNRSAGC